MLEVDSETSRSRSAAIPHVVRRQDPPTPAAEGKAVLRMARHIYRRWYGKLPRLQPLHPYWAAMRHLIRLVDTAAQNGAANVLVVTGSEGVADTAADHLS